MNPRLFLCLFLSLTFFACGEKKEKADTTTHSNVSEETKTTNKVVTDISFDEKIKRIKSNFSAIENALSSLEKKIVTENIGGGFREDITYLDAGIPKKIKHGNYGEHGSIAHTFYLNDNKLFFVFEEAFSEASLDGPYTKKEKRYYIYDGKLIRVLEKESTVKSAGAIDMSNVKNVDVTDQWISKLSVVSEFEETLREITSNNSQAETVGLDNGRWISVDDANAGIEIKNGKLIMFHKGKTTNSNNIFEYELSEKDGIEYLTLQNDTGEKIIYGLLEYSDESMVLSYLDRGSTLTYKKEK